MPVCVYLARVSLRVIGLLLLVLLLACSGYPQGVPPAGGARMNANNERPAQVNVSVRDSRGLPLEVPAMVHLSSTVKNFDMTLPTREAAIASFPSVTPGEYQLEVRCTGYISSMEHLSIYTNGSEYPVFVYLNREGDPASSVGPPSGTTMTPKLRAEIDKALRALQKQQYETARDHLVRAEKLAPSNLDVLYLLGVAEIGLKDQVSARSQFEHVLSLDPSHERALLGLGELQLRAGETSSAIASLEKAFSANGANWRTHLLLAVAYAKTGKMVDAESHATRAAALAGPKGASVLLFLGDVQLSRGERAEAQKTWGRVVAEFPGDTAATSARHKLEQLAAAPVAAEQPSADLPLPALPKTVLPPLVERPWAPPSVDDKEYDLAPSVSCDLEAILDRAEQRLISQLGNFEKFTGTEHIEHQEVDRHGRPGPVRSKDFSYIVFVRSVNSGNFYLEESRDGGVRLDQFPTSLATTGLNSLGVNVLQPLNRDQLSFRCEGLTRIRGQAVWQLHFAENNTAPSGVREWKKNGTVYKIPIKGRLWVSDSTYDILRIETDLEQPMEILGLTRDHLEVDYGPVTFSSRHTQMWLPWTAEMYLELRGKRYHHKHYLSDYMLFAVDTGHRINQPKEAPPAAPAEQN